MRYPISSMVANLVMEELENEILAGVDYVPHFYIRYADDCLLCIPISELNCTHQVFNSI